MTNLIVDAAGGHVFTTGNSAFRGCGSGFGEGGLDGFGLGGIGGCGLGLARHVLKKGLYRYTKNGSKLRTATNWLKPPL
jgi:hypothetical protein